MKKLSAALLALLLILTGCQKQQRQADIRLPEPETPAAEETIAEPAEEPEQESVAPDLGHLQRASGSSSNAANTGGLEKQPGIRDDHGAKGKSSQSTDSAAFTTGRTASVFGIPHGATVICPVWRLKYSGVFLGSEDLEREAETPLEWFRTWFIWAFGHIHEADAEGLQAQYPASLCRNLFAYGSSRDMGRCGRQRSVLSGQGSAITTSISLLHEIRSFPTSVKTKKSGRFRIR